MLFSTDLITGHLFLSSIPKCTCLYMLVHARIQMSTITDEVQQTLKTLSEKGTNGVSDEQLKDFKKRKLIVNQ